MTTSKAVPNQVHRVLEVEASDLPSLTHAGWARAYPWLVQGTTTRGAGLALFDLGLFSGGSAESRVRRNWSRLRVATGMTDVVHARQVHGAEIRTHRDLGPVENRAADSGAMPLLVEPCDGHVTSSPGLLLAVTAADCVPVFVVDAEHRAVAAIHAGWRGTAAGVLERGLGAMHMAFGTRTDAVYVHFGPAICGSCYEVGPEVFAAVGQPVPSEAEPIDLRAVLVERALLAGVDAEKMSVSGHCTRCTGSGLFSHRGGDAQRQVGFVGIRP